MLRPLILAIRLAIGVSVSAETDAGVVYNNPGGLTDNLANAYLVRVKPGLKANFFNSSYPDTCPAFTSECRKKAYVVGGDLLVATRTKGSFTIVDYVTIAGRRTEGAVETRLLDVVPPVKDPPLSSWAGAWNSEDAHISVVINEAAGAGHIEGSNIWGENDPDRVSRGGVHSFDFEGPLYAEGEWSGYAEEWNEGAGSLIGNADWRNGFPYREKDPVGCQIRLRLLAPDYLVAYDDGYCGGSYTNFSGVYRHQVSDNSP